MNDKLCSIRPAACIARVHQRMPGLRIAAACWLVVFASTVFAADDALEFRFADGSSIAGRLVTAKNAGTFAIRSELFDKDLRVSTSELLEGRRIDASRVETRAEPSPRNEDPPTFALVLRDGCQFVGSIVGNDDEAIVLATATLGKIRVKASEIVGVTERARTPIRLFSLANSKSRYRRESGWEFRREGLWCDVPGAAVVANLDLPERFRVRLVVQCRGVPDFEISLGDRSAGGAGQGRGGEFRRIDRRGGSLSRLPTERYVTRLEWLDRSVTVVRSNASVSDAAVFELTNTNDGTSTEHTLELDLFVDQRRGIALAFRNGLKIGQASLNDDAPVIRGVMTLINRRDPVAVERLDVFRWDGVEPESQALPARYTLLRDGRVLPGIADGFQAEGFRIGDETLPWSAVAELSLARPSEISGSCEWTLIDGSRIRGTIIEGATKDSGTVLNRIVVQYASGAVAIQPASVTRFVGRAYEIGEEERDGSRILAAGVDFRGSLRAREERTVPFHWQPYFGGDALGIVADQGVEVRLGAHDGESVAAIGQTTTQALIEFANGDRLGAKQIRLANGSVRFIGEICGETSIPFNAIERIQWSPIDDVDPSELGTLLRLPRRMKETPPTHAVMSTDGDVLRGRLTAIDGQRVRLEVRGRKHDLDRNVISQVIRLHVRDDSHEHDDSQGHGDSEVRVITANGGRFGLSTVAFDGTTISGVHHVVGDCRINITDVKSIQFGIANNTETRPWTIVPVKEPRTFDERDEER